MDNDSQEFKFASEEELLEHVAACFLKEPTIGAVYIESIPVMLHNKRMTKVRGIFRRGRDIRSAISSYTQYHDLSDYRVCIDRPSRSLFRYY